MGGVYTEIRVSTESWYGKRKFFCRSCQDSNNNNNVHLSCAHQCLSTHTIHINLNIIFYTHVEYSPTKTIYIKYYTEKQTHALHTHNDCSRNWVLILVGMKKNLWPLDQESGTLPLSYPRSYTDRFPSKLLVLHTYKIKIIKKQNVDNPHPCGIVNLFNRRRKTESTSGFGVSKTACNLNYWWILSDIIHSFSDQKGTQTLIHACFVSNRTKKHCWQ